MSDFNTTEKKSKGVSRLKKPTPCKTVRRDKGHNPNLSMTIVPKISLLARFENGAGAQKPLRYPVNGGASTDRAHYSRHKRAESEITSVMKDFKRVISSKSIEHIDRIELKSVDSNIRLNQGKPPIPLIKN